MSSDSIVVFGDFYPGQEKAACILLFHPGSCSPVKSDPSAFWEMVHEFLERVKAED